MKKLLLRFGLCALLLGQFAAALSEADRVVLLDIYPSRETDTLGVSADDILALMPDRARVRRVGKPTDAATALLDAHAAGELSDGAVVLTLGAGDVTEIAAMVLDGLRN
jgi:UDP-N-acetylmuramate--alanine ligase